MVQKFESLEWDEIVSIQASANILISHPTFKVSELAKAIKVLIRGYDNVAQQTIKKAGDSNHIDDWFSEGVECEVLKYSAKGWQKGKVRLTLEFCPDEPEIEELPANTQPEITEPESPLDDLHRMMNENMNGTSS